MLGTERTTVFCAAKAGGEMPAAASARIARIDFMDTAS
jgi:hypothetical protein